MDMPSLLENFVCGRWIAGDGTGDVLVDPVLGTELARVSTDGIDLHAALDYARCIGGIALRELTFAKRASMLESVAKLLIGRRDSYVDIARANSGNTDRDAAFDIDGAIGTIRYFAKLGASLGGARYVCDGKPVALGRDPSLEAVHLGTARAGAAIHINAFNFPAWGTWEKAAVSLLAGVPVVTKPATATSLLTWHMVHDVVDAGLFPHGALSLLCGGVGDLLDHVEPPDVIAFTGSAATAARVRSHARVVEQSVRVNCEADSLNAIILGPDVRAGSPEFAMFVDEVVREMTLKAGQKCTAIRRIVVPRWGIDEVAGGISEALSSVVVGDPREQGVSMGPVVNVMQQLAVQQAATRLRSESSVVYEGRNEEIRAAEPERGAFVMPLLLRVSDSTIANAVHEIEAFGPIATLLPYATAEEAWRLVARGRGSLVSSVVTADEQFACDTALAIASVNGRVLLLDESVSSANPGHGVVVPSCIHGGPGRAGGGEELGGLRGLSFYLQRTAIQGPSAAVRRLAQSAVFLGSV